jgi:hypothetical protein
MENPNQRPKKSHTANKIWNTATVVFEIVTVAVSIYWLSYFVPSPVSCTAYYSDRPYAAPKSPDRCNLF